jgi:CheY-like chemotaxis protein
MKPSPGLARVLVAGDNADDTDQIQRQLKSQFDHLAGSSKPDHAVEDFDNFKPDVLVLAFDSLEKAQGYYLGLYRLGSTAHHHPHRTVLLCNKDDVRTAFELCKKEYFDDYVLYWPHTHDGPRLAMSIWLASREMMAHRSALPSAGDLRVHARQLGELERVIEDQLSHGVRQIETVRGTLEGIEHPANAQVAGAINSLDAWASSFQNRVAPAFAATRAMTNTLSKIRPVVMVVDDDEMTRQLIGRALDRSAFEIVFAADGAEALSQLRRVRPDAILMDIRMPGLDGVTLARRLKSAPTLANIPIIMLTGEARRETLMSSMEAGAVAFIVKPFTREALLGKLQKVLG